MNGLYLTLPIFLPLVGGLVSYLIRFPNSRSRHLFYGVLICLTSAVTWLSILRCGSESFQLLRFTEELTLTLRMDGASRLFAGLAATLWPFTMLYAFDYMSHEKHLSMFWSFFTVSFGVTLGVAFAGNMMTMYLFYELLTLATLPLVMQPMSTTARKAGVKYAVYSMSGAALAFIGNIFVALWNLVVDVFVMIYNLVATVANFIGNVFNDPVGAVARLFFDLADTVLSVLQALASAIDTIFGSNLAGSVQGWRDSLGGWVDSTFGKGEEIMEKLNAEDLHLGRFEYGAAFDMGYEFGQGVEDTVGGLFDFSAMDSLGAADGLDAFNLGNTLDGIYGNTGDTAGNTAAMSDALDIAEEDLAYMRDIAEREAINRFTTAEIKVEQHNENHISKDADLDGIMDAWANDFAEKLEVSEEGVHE